jgi:hypothetical protein
MLGGTYQMDFTKCLNSKTALEHLIFLNNKNVVGVCRELQITPQQFTDWIKKRRPVPEERLQQLAKYFNISADMLADKKRFALSLSALSRIQLEIVAVSNQKTQSSSEQETEELNCRLDKLEQEKQKQIRISRLSAILEKNDTKTMARIDAMLDELENINL